MSPLQRTFIDCPVWRSCPNPNFSLSWTYVLRATTTTITTTCLHCVCDLLPSVEAPWGGGVVSVLVSATAHVLAQVALNTSSAKWALNNESTYRLLCWDTQLASIWKNVGLKCVPISKGDRGAIRPFKGNWNFMAAQTNPCFWCIFCKRLT